MKTAKAFTLVEVAIVVVIVGLLIAMAVPACTAIQSNSSPETYRVWCKLHKRDDLTFEEWKAAKRAGLITIQPVIAPTAPAQQPARFR